MTALSDTGQTTLMIGTSVCWITGVGMCLNEDAMAPIGTASREGCVRELCLSVWRGGGSTTGLRSQPASNPGRRSAASIGMRMNYHCLMCLDYIERVKP